MLAHYRGENTRLEKPVIYITPAQQAKYQVEIHNGFIYFPSSVPSGLESSQPRLFSSYTNTPAIYVITKDGRLLISQFSRHEHFVHASLVAGEEVLAAGEVVVVDGKITALNLESGHYRPGYERFAFVREFLNRKGIDTSHIRMSPTAVTEALPAGQMSCIRSLSSQML